MSDEPVTPKEYLDMVDLEFSLNLWRNVFAMYGWDFKKKDDIEEFIAYEASSSGFSVCLSGACRECGREKLWSYLDSVEWFDYDIIVDEILTKAAGLLEKYKEENHMPQDYRFAIYRWLLDAAMDGDNKE